MDYYKWKRRIKIQAFILLLSACAFGLFLFHELTVYARYNMPVEIIYPLSEIPEDQAVMSVFVNNYPHENYGIVANKDGRWKIYMGVDYGEFEKVYGKDYFSNEYDDYILENESIPWQPEKIDIDSKILEQALNMKKVKFFSSSVGLADGGNIYWYLIEPVSKRESISYCDTLPINNKHILLYMQNRFRELEDAGRRVYDFQYWPHVM